jgi:hypothetical protein
MTDETIQQILQRNVRVETDKAWERSKTRRGVIVGATYLVAGAYMSALGGPLPWLNALIPAFGYLFSTLSLPHIRDVWVKKFHEKRIKNDHQ